jgi:hypothetical protein
MPYLQIGDVLQSKFILDNLRNIDLWKDIRIIENNDDINKAVLFLTTKPDQYRIVRLVAVE